MKKEKHAKKTKQINNPLGHHKSCKWRKAFVEQHKEWCRRNSTISRKTM